MKGKHQSDAGRDPALEMLLGESQNAAQEISEISREDILRQIFGDIGELLDDFTCAVESTVLLHGRMYITTKFICFYSNLFGLEKKIRIPYSHIRSITKQNTAVVIPNAISLATDKKNYVFRSFWDREICFRMLTTFVEKIKNNQPIDRSSMPMHRASKRPGSTRSHHADSNASESDVSSVASSNRSHLSMNFRRGTSVRDPAASPTSTSTSTPPAVPSSQKSAEAGKDDEEDNEFDTESGIKPQSSAVDPAAEYEEDKVKATHKIPVITGEVLQVSMKEFEALFITDEAPYNYKRYHESVKDTNVTINNWTEMGALGKGRELKFFKPVNLPGLASTRGKKVQRYRQYEEVGLILQSSTALEDVPAADTFSVEDSLMVKCIDANSVSVDISFQVKFIKSTMMKYLIERSTNTEMQKWLEAFFKNMQKMCQLHKEGKLDTSVTTTDTAVEAAPAAAAPPPPSAPVPAVKQPASLLEGFASMFSFQNEVLGDQIKFFMCIFLALYLVVNFARWKMLSAKLAHVEQQLEGLESLTQALLAKINAENVISNE